MQLNNPNIAYGTYVTYLVTRVTALFTVPYAYVGYITNEHDTQ